MESKSSISGFLAGATFSPLSVALLSTMSLLLVGVLDYLTGYEVSFAIFYLIPVTTAAWFAGKYWGLLFAVASSLAWYAAEMAAGYTYSHASIPVWNASVRLVFFLLIASLLTSLRRYLVAEQRMAMTDTLTGLWNLRAFQMQLEHEFALAGRIGSPVTLVYIDLNDFKVVNDTLGHVEGDKVLRATAKKLQHAVREMDTVARLGGDEFALILPSTALSGAQSLIDRLVRSLDGKSRTGKEAKCSIGAVVFPTPPRTMDEAIAAADEQMYLVKKGSEKGPKIAVYSTPPGRDTDVETVNRRDRSDI